MDTYKQQEPMKWKKVLRLLMHLVRNRDVDGWVLQTADRDCLAGEQAIWMAGMKETSWLVEERHGQRRHPLATGGTKRKSTRINHPYSVQQCWERRGHKNSNKLFVEVWQLCCAPKAREQPGTQHVTSMGGHNRASGRRSS